MTDRAAAVGRGLAVGRGPRCRPALRRHPVLAAPRPRPVRPRPRPRRGPAPARGGAGRHPGRRRAARPARRRRHRQRLPLRGALGRTRRARHAPRHRSTTTGGAPSTPPRTGCCGANLGDAPAPDRADRARGLRARRRGAARAATARSARRVSGSRRGPCGGARPVRLLRDGARAPGAAAGRSPRRTPPRPRAGAAAFDGRRQRDRRCARGRDHPRRRRTRRRAASAATCSRSSTAPATTGGETLAVISAGRAPAAADPDGRPARDARRSDAAPRSRAPSRSPGAVAGWETLAPHGRAAPVGVALRASGSAPAFDGSGAHAASAATLPTPTSEPCSRPTRGCAAVFFPDGEPLARGELVRQPALGATLEALAAGGAEALYRGRGRRGLRRGPPRRRLPDHDRGPRAPRGRDRAAAARRVARPARAASRRRPRPGSRCCRS